MVLSLIYFNLNTQTQRLVFQREDQRSAKSFPRPVINHFNKAQLYRPVSSDDEHVSELIPWEPFFHQCFV